MITDKDFEANKSLYVAKPDPDFSPDRNKAIIEGTIKKYEETVEKKRKEYRNQVAERSDAVATYLKSLSNGSNKPVEKYFSRQELAHLRGQKILQMVANQNGRDYIKLVEL